jgi:hypothetical protein
MIYFNVESWTSLGTICLIKSKNRSVQHVIRNHVLRSCFNRGYIFVVIDKIDRVLITKIEKIRGCRKSEIDLSGDAMLVVGHCHSMKNGSTISIKKEMV